MCVVSMVFDHYNTNPRWPWKDTTTWPVQPNTNPLLPPTEISELRQLIKEFREAVAAARKVDVLTKRPDCEDPVKAKLEERVAELERRLGLA